MEPYINRDWTQCQANAYIDEAVAWSENGNHAPFYCAGIITEEADAKLAGTLRELNLMPETSLLKKLSPNSSVIPNQVKSARKRGSGIRRGPEKGHKGVFNGMERSRTLGRKSENVVRSGDAPAGLGNMILSLLRVGRGLASPLAPSGGRRSTEMIRDMLSGWQGVRRQRPLLILMLALVLVAAASSVRLGA